MDNSLLGLTFGLPLGALTTWYILRSQQAAANTETRQQVTQQQEQGRTAEPQRPPPANTNGGQQAQATQNPLGNVSANLTSLSLPTFYQNKPEAWFTTIDLQFDDMGADEVTRLRKAVAKMPPEVADQLSHITARPFIDGDYQLMKNELLRIFGKSKESRYDEIDALVEVTHLKPSAVLAKIRSLAHSSNPEEAIILSEDDIKRRLLRALPPPIQNTLRHLLGDIPMEKFVKLADREFECLPSTSVMAISKTDNQISSDQVNAIRKQRVPKTKQQDGLCFYHTTFGDKAKKCAGPPCPKNGQGPQ